MFLESCIHTVYTVHTHTQTRPTKTLCSLWCHSLNILYIGQKEWHEDVETIKIPLENLSFELLTEGKGPKGLVFLKVLHTDGQSSMSTLERLQGGLRIGRQGRQGR